MKQTMKQLKHKDLRLQKGVSKFGLLMLFILIAGFLTFGLKVAPFYVDHNMIAVICEELIENGNAASMSQSDVRERVSNSLRINNIDGFDISDIKMRKVNDLPVITIAYERRVNIAGNLDVFASFDTVLQ